MKFFENLKSKGVVIDKFVLSMIIAVIVSFIVPQIGAKGSPLHLDLATTWGVSLVFFLHGANLSFDAVKAGIGAWKLHLFIQCTTFIIFPIIGFIAFFATSGLIGEDVRLGFFFLCALPSTISSSVAMTALGKGNVAGAIFDATLSGILGMIITPFLISLVAKNAGIGDLPVLASVLDIMKTLLLPFVLGQLLRPLIGKIMSQNKKLITLTDRTVIVMIVFVAFCNSNVSGVWLKFSPILLIGIFIATGALLAFVLSLTRFCAKTFGFNHEDEVAGVFCASKKSLANGAPIAAILFAGNPILGVILLPTMIYHQLQLMVCSILAQRYAAKLDSLKS